MVLPVRRVLLICLSTLLLTPQASRAAEGLAGTYVGDYTNKAGKTGGYQLTLVPAAGGAWTGEVVAVLDGRPTKSPMTSLQVRGDTIEAAYDFVVQGHKVSSRISGQRTGPELTGKFETIYKGKVVDTGTWKTTRKK
jgi:hypothetical protein